MERVGSEETQGDIKPSKLSRLHGRMSKLDGPCMKIPEQIGIRKRRRVYLTQGMVRLIVLQLLW